RGPREGHRCGEACCLAKHGRIRGWNKLCRGVSRPENQVRWAVESAARGENVAKRSRLAVETHDRAHIEAGDVEVAVGAEGQSLGPAQGRCRSEGAQKRARLTVITENAVAVKAVDVEVAVRPEGDARRDIESAAVRGNEGCSAQSGSGQRSAGCPAVTHD